MHRQTAFLACNRPCLPCMSGRCAGGPSMLLHSNVVHNHTQLQLPAHCPRQQSTSPSFTSCHRAFRCRRTERLLVYAGSQPSRLRQTQQLPIFPLGLVAMPHAVTPLNIFEARYRVLFSTLLAGDEGIEQGLVNDESPFRATRQFGISLVHQSGVSEIGTMLRIEQHKQLADGQIVIVSRGVQRFKMTKVVQERPILIAEVELLPEEEDISQEARQLAADVCNITKQLLELNVKMRKLRVKKEEINPPELSDLYPTRLSYFVASLLLDNMIMQQALLMEDSTVKRLSIEKETLKSTLQYMSARSALQGAFTPSTEPSTTDTESKPDSS